MLSAIPVKLLFLISAFFIWRHLFRIAAEQKVSVVTRWLLGGAIASVVLSVMAIGKIYPYGVSTDLLVFAAASAAVMALPGRLLTIPLHFVLLGTVLLGPIIYLGHYVVVGGGINKDSIIAVFETTPTEASEYYASFMSVAAYAMLAAVALVAAWLTFRITKSQKSAGGWKAVGLIAVSLVLIAISPVERGLFTYPVNVYLSYSKDLETIKERLAQFNSRETDTFSATKDAKGEIYVVVIGESLNKHHMSLYGYDLDTTPRLRAMQESGELTVITNSYSNYPRTVPALSNALSQANQRNGMDYLDAVGLPAVLNHAGFDTYWFGNQPLSTSYDMALGLLAKEANEVELTFDANYTSSKKGEQKPDAILFPLIDRALARDSERNQLIFVHLAGNHTSYCNRYPSEFARYSVSPLKSAWMHLFSGGPGRSRECYDNSILYNDYVVSTIIDKVKAVTGDKPGAVFYFADHADDVTRGGHSSSNFSYDMVDAPAMFWVSDEYRQKYPEKMAALTTNADQYFGNDFVFDSVIGLTGITTTENIYCDSCDLFNFHYSLPIETALTMHGKKAYIPPKPAAELEMKITTRQLDVSQPLLTPSS